MFRTRLCGDRFMKIWSKEILIRHNIEAAKQGGGGIAGMYAKKPYMIPVNPRVTPEPEEKLVVGKQVSPVTAVEERARSELEDAIEGNKPHIPITIKGQKFAIQPVLSYLLSKQH